MMGRISRGFWLGLFCLGLAWTGVQDADAAMFMKYDGIDGEAKDKDHKAWIDVLSVAGAPSLGRAADGTCPAAPGGAGDIVVVRELDKSSTKLQEALCDGGVVPEVVIHMHRSKKSEEEYVVWVLTNVQVVNYSIGTTTDKKGKSIPTEEVTLGYTEIEWTYKTTRDE